MITDDNNYDNNSICLDFKYMYLTGLVTEYSLYIVLKIIHRGNLRWFWV